MEHPGLWGRDMHARQPPRRVPYTRCRRGKGTPESPLLGNFIQLPDVPQRAHPLHEPSTASLAQQLRIPEWFGARGGRKPAEQEPPGAGKHVQ